MTVSTEELQEFVDRCRQLLRRHGAQTDQLIVESHAVRAEVHGLLIMEEASRNYANSSVLAVWTQDPSAGMILLWPSGECNLEMKIDRKKIGKHLRVLRQAMILDDMART